MFHSRMAGCFTQGHEVAGCFTQGWRDVSLKDMRWKIDTLLQGIFWDE